MPQQDELKLDPDAAYVHMHVEQHDRRHRVARTLPEVGDVPLVTDTSSDMFSRPIDVAKYALIYAGAQKNLAPAGVTLVIIRDDLLQRIADSRCRRC